MNSITDGIGVLLEDLKNQTRASIWLLKVDTDLMAYHQSLNQSITTFQVEHAPYCFLLSLSQRDEKDLVFLPPT